MTVAQTAVCTIVGSISKLIEPYVDDEDRRTFKNVTLNIPTKMGSFLTPTRKGEPHAK